MHFRGQVGACLATADGAHATPYGTFTAVSDMLACMIGCLLVSLHVDTAASYAGRDDSVERDFDCAGESLSPKKIMLTRKAD